MRKSFDGLSGLILRDEAPLPTSTSVFVFINKGRNKMKLLHWTGGGFVLYYKRLEEGNFEVPDYEIEGSLIVLDYTKIVMLIDGISILNIKKRKRY
jgi:transposase